MSASDKDAYSAEYFAALYGNVDAAGEPAQTVFDRWRDGMLVRLYQRHGAKPVAQSRVVDVGCGFGWLLDWFDDAAELCGSDIAEHAIEMANKRRPQRTYRVADLQERAPFEGTFDLVLAINLIEHLPEPERGLDSIAALCAPGSIVLVHMPTVNNWFTKWSYEKLYASDPTHIYRPKGKDVAQMFKARGFEVVRHSFLPHWPAWLTRVWPLHPAYLAVFRFVGK